MKNTYRISKRGLRGLVITIPNKVGRQMGVRAGQQLEFRLMEGRETYLAYKVPARRGAGRKKRK